MTPELSKALADLASRLGTSADKLFPILVAKTKLDALVVLWGCGIGAVIFFALALFIVYAIVEWGWDELGFFPASIAAATAIIMFAFSISSIGDYHYPEASALQSLINR